MRSQSRRDYQTAVAGILAAVTFVPGVICSVSSPDSAVSDAKALAWYADQGHRMTNIIGGYLIAVTGVLMLRFAAGLRERLRASDGKLGNVAFGGAIAFVSMLWIGTAAAIAISGAKSFGGVKGPQSADLVRFLPQIGYAAILLFAMFGAIAMVVATSTVAIRTGTLPRWLGWFGLLCAVALLFAVVFLPMVALPVWLLVTSVVLFRLPAAEASAAVARPEPGLSAAV